MNKMKEMFDILEDWQKSDCGEFIIYENDWKVVKVYWDSVVTFVNEETENSYMFIDMEDADDYDYQEMINKIKY